MLLVSCQKIDKNYGDQSVLRDLSFTISSGQKVGLIGPNGSGKTTILRIITGLEHPTQGTAVIPPSVTIGYVPQYMEFNEDMTVMDYILQHYKNAKTVLEEKEKNLAQAPESRMKQAMNSYQKARDDFEKAGGYQFPSRAQGVLDAFSLSGKEHQKIEKLSGGEKNALSLARTLLDEPDLLLLDEPANHLDYIGVARLEDFLKRYKGAVCIVSHRVYQLSTAGPLDPESSW